MRVLRLTKSINVFFLILFLSSCVTSQKPDRAEIPRPYISLAEDGLIYDASITYKDFQASGLLVLKRIKAEDYHVVLLSKFGPAIMEFKMDGTDLTWIKTFDKLQNQVVQNFIERDFRMILLSTLENPRKINQLRNTSTYRKYKLNGETKAHILIDPETKNVVYAENRGFINLFKTKIEFDYNNKDVPEAISIRHNNLKLNIDLNLLKEI